MSLAHLRWLAFLVPSTLTTAFLVALHLIGPHFAHSLTGALVSAAIIAFGAYVFTAWVFGIIERSESESRKRQAQVEALNQAAIHISRDLDLDAVLQKVADSARELLGAQYCALQVMPGEGFSTHLVTSGLNPHVREGMGPPPKGLGVLGLVLQRGRPVRVSEISRHPASVGFPPGHPPMGSFLGAPILSRDRMLGQLYLSNKLPAPEFSEEDEQVAEMLANQAAVAIQNAHLYEDARRTGLYLQSLIAASHDAIVVLSAQGEVRLWNRGAEVIYRLSPEDAVGLVLPMLPPDGREATLAMVAEALQSGAVSGREAIHRTKDEVPVPVLLTLSRLEADIGQEPVVIMIAKDMTANRRLESQRRRLALLEERQRISMDLHDGAIQALYAVGLGLGTTRLVLGKTHSEARERLSGALDQINGVIRQLREYIVNLRTPMPERSLAKGLMQIAQRLREVGRVEVDLRMQGETGELAEEVTVHLLHIAGEAASNVVRHAEASRVDIQLDVGVETAALTIRDDGHGFEPETVSQGQGFGLCNMQTRSRLLGGSFALTTAEGAGATVTVTVPLRGGEAWTAADTPS